MIKFLTNPDENTPIHPVKNFNQENMEFEFKFYSLATTKGANQILFSKFTGHISGQFKLAEINPAIFAEEVSKDNRIIS